MPTVETKIIEINGEELEGVFEQGKHGWFCHDLNGIHWDYKLYGHQPSEKTAIKAALNLLKSYEEYGESLAIDLWNK